MRSLVEQDCRVSKIHRVESVPLQQWVMPLIHVDKNLLCNKHFACVRADMINDKTVRTKNWMQTIVHFVTKCVEIQDIKSGPKSK